MNLSEQGLSTTRKKSFKEEALECDNVLADIYDALVVDQAAWQLVTQKYIYFVNSWWHKHVAF